MARILGRRSYDRAPVEVARDLLGAVVESETAAGLVRVRLVEVEAYAGEDDPASHAWRGVTPRTQVMYGKPGVAYVYLSMGIHFCLNVVCEAEGRASAVLLRAGVVVDGVELARDRRQARGPVPDRRLASGPGNLGAALCLDLSWDGTDLTTPGSRLRLRAGALRDGEVIGTGPRVGISRATETPWRFRILGDPHVSGPARER